MERRKERSDLWAGSSILLALLLLASTFAKAQKEDPWGIVLHRYVTKDGFVDYEGLKKKQVLLERALADMRKGAPSPEASDHDRIAFWINAYNAFAIDLVLDHYPIKSIRDIDKAFERKFIGIGDKTYSLNGIEKGILLKKFEDPRIHYAVNCASIGCPPLRREPYRGEKLDRQLRDQAERFINDPSKNELARDRVRISKLYDWYRSDFTKNGSLIEHLNRYAKGVTIAPDARIDFMTYDWGLNQKER